MRAIGAAASGILHPMIVATAIYASYYLKIL